MREIVHGGDVYSYLTPGSDLIDFSANINPLGMPLSVRQAITDALTQSEHYPDPLCRKLVAALASYEGVAEEMLFIGNGAADLIFRLVFALSPQKALLLAPTFSEYEQALRVNGCEVTYHQLKREEDFCLTEEVLEKLTDELDVLFLCNPNNPTGQPVETKLMEKIVSCCEEHGIILIADECFNDLLDDPKRYTIQHRFANSQHLVILKAFTKFYAMAGLRLGYLMTSNTALLDAVSQAGQPWAVSVLAQVAGVAALGDIAYRQQTKQWLSVERAHLKQGLRGLGMHVVGSHANYIFFESTRTDLCDRLLEKGILIRSCQNYQGLDDRWYRVAVRKKEENTALLNALLEILS